MPWIIIIGYLAVHFVLYVAVFRFRPVFRTEGGIFLYHMVSAAALLVLAIAALIATPSIERFALCLGLLALHGIYSLSFLEAWALSEGGYSLRILTEIEKRTSATPTSLTDQFAALSARKKAGRLETLIGIGLVQQNGPLFQVTRKGAAVAKLLAVLGSLTVPVRE